MKVTVEETSSYERVVTVEVPSEKVKEEMEKLYREISKTADHPGFRKGKVPRKILEGKHGKAIRQEAISAIVTSSAKDAFEEQDIKPLTEPLLGEMDFGDEGPLSFKVTAEIQPEIELGEYKGITLERPKREVGDEDVAKVLERLRLSNAKYAPADRPIEKGDIVVLDFEAFEGDKPIEGGKGENFSLEVGSGQFGEEFEGQLPGISKDEDKKIEVNYPDDYHAEDLAGKAVRFEVKIKDVKVRELPELDDDFAKDLGEHETLDELKDHWKKKIEEDLEKRMEELLREQALMKIVEASKVDVPPRFKEKVAASIFEQRVNSMAQYGTDRQTIASQQDQLVEFAEKEADRQIRVSFVSDEIAERESLTVSNDELENSLNEMEEKSKADGPEGGKGPDLREYFKQEQVRERYRDQLRARKILDFIVDGAKIEEVEEGQVEPEIQEPTEDKEGDS